MPVNKELLIITLLPVKIVHKTVTLVQDLLKTVPLVHQPPELLLQPNVYALMDSMKLEPSTV